MGLVKRTPDQMGWMDDEEEPEGLQSLDYALYFLASCLHTVEPLSIPATVYFPSENQHTDNARERRARKILPDLVIEKVPGTHLTCISQFAGVLAQKIDETLNGPRRPGVQLAREVPKKAALLYGSRGKTFLSGTPYYLARALQAIEKESHEFDVIDISPKRSREVPLTYLRWCLESGLTNNHWFLLSRTYHDRCGKDIVVPDNVRPYFVVWGQCIPGSILNYRRTHRDARIIVYTDATFLDLFDLFDYVADVPDALRRKMLADERECYAQSDLITVFHEDVRKRMIKDYGVKPEKISVLGRGTNLEREMTDGISVRRRSEIDHKFHMMVVGRGPKRKGVYRLIEAIDSLSPDEQSRLVLTVVGPKKRELPTRHYLRQLGFIPGARRDGLAREMAAADLGVLLSDADSLPGSIWEFLTLGVPVWISRAALALNRP